MFFVCKKSTECDGKDVCDRNKHVCRESLRKPARSKATLAKECLTKGIPINYERAPHAGQRKNRHALEYCKYQRSRNKIQGPMKLLPAPPVKIPSIKEPEKVKMPEVTRSSYHTRSKAVEEKKKKKQVPSQPERPATRMMTRAAARRA